MGLDLSNAAVISVDEEEIDEGGVHYALGIEEELRAKGLMSFDKPKHHPPALADIVVEEQTLDQLAALHAQYVAYQAYLSTVVARADIEKRVAASNLKLIVAKIKSALHAKGIPEKEVGERVRLHSMYLKYDLEAAKALYRHTILLSYDRAYGKVASAISRCIAAQSDEREALKREGNVGYGNYGRTGRVTRPHERPRELPKLTVEGPKKTKRAK